MGFHTQQFPSPAQKIDQAKAFLRFLAAGQMKDSEYAALLRKEAQRLLDRRADPILYHDDLADINRPYYFHEFAALAGQHGLQFLAEADFFEMQDTMQPPAVLEALKQFSGNIVLKEQYLDFIKCRRFRQTLLCRDAVGLQRTLQPGLVRSYLIASQTKPNSATPDLKAGVLEGFTGPRGTTMQADDPLAKAAMLVMFDAWPRPLPFDLLVKSAAHKLACVVKEDEADRLAEVLLAAYATGLIEFHVHQAFGEGLDRQRPILSPLVRFQLLRGQEVVASLRHTGSRIDVPIVREMLLLLDGTRDVGDVSAELGRRIDAGELTVPAGAVRDNLAADLEKGIQDARTEGLLPG